MYIGSVDGKWRCNISGSAANSMILITGVSGAGKSVRKHIMELEAAKDSSTIIAVDTGFTHSPENMYQPIVAEYEGYVNRIDAARGGINLSPFRNGNDEVSIIALSHYYGMGSQQTAILREAVSLVKGHSPGGDDLAILNLALQRCGGHMLQEKMQVLLNCGIIRQNDSRIQRGRINIIDLSWLDSNVQEPLSELILAQCWRYLQKCKGNSGNVVISLDEIQNLTFNRKHSPLHRMLREGRKFKMSFLLATQTLSGFSNDAISVLDQASTHLYFRPPTNEIKKIAHAIDVDKQAAWCRKLANLKVGQCVATGEFSVNGVAVSHPLILR